MHSGLELGTVLRRSYFFKINFLPLSGEFDYRRELQEVLKCLSKQNKVRVWSETEYATDCE